MRLANQFAVLVDAYARCVEKGNTEWEENHKERMEALIQQYLPSGSGFDSGTHLDFDTSTGERLVFRTSFHHMNDSGMYDGWTDHEVIVTPSLVFGFNIRVTGKDKRQIKEYIVETFNEILHKDIVQ